MDKSVLITGASTGIGFDAAQTLAKNGFKVFASVRSEQDKQKFDLSGITPVILDVAKPQEIKTAFEKISQEAKGSFSLVNNAGIAVAGPMEGLSVDDYRKQFDVNFFGLIEVTKTFLPLVKKSKGRIVNLSSVSGLASSPFLGAYSASKYAVEAISDALRWELLAARVKVVIIEPGPIATPIWQKGMSIEVPDIPEYKEAATRFSKIVAGIEKSALPVEKTSQAILKALTVKNPPARIMVAHTMAKARMHLTRKLPTRLVDRAMEKLLFKK